MHILKSFDPDEIGRLRAQEEFFWLDLRNPGADTIAQVGQALGLHPLAVEDTQEFGQRPKLDLYGDDQLLLVYFGAVAGSDGPVGVEVHLHVSPRFVLSVHRTGCPAFDRVEARFQSSPPQSGQVLIYRVIDALTDSVLDVLEQVADRIDAYETEVFHRPRARDRDEMAVLRRSLQTLRRVLAIQRQVFDRAVEQLNALMGSGESLTSEYRDVGDHLLRAIDEAEASRDSLQGMLETYTNEVQERLTIVATIFLPLTVITGFFGQNFNWLIDHIGAGWAFWGLGIGLLIVSGLAILGWLVRSGLYCPPWRR